MIRRTAAVSLVAAVSVAVAPTAASQSAGAGFDEASAGFVLPDDELFQQQWYLFNHGQEIGGVTSGASDADVFAPEAWAITTGSPDVVVAVLDTGVDVDHPDLAPNIWHNPGETGDGKESNGVDDDGNGYIDDYQGWDFLQDDNVPQGLRSNDNEAGSPIEHGTAVASLIAAAGGDGTGMTGIAPNVRIMPLRGLGSEQQITEAIAYAIDNGAQIVNLSFGSPGVLGAGEAYKGLIEANPQVLFVGGTGNSALDIDNPNGFVPCTLPYDNVLCVAGTDPSDELWFVERGSGSNYGATGADIAAPAAEMLVAQPPLTPIFSDDFESGLASWAVTATQGDEFVADEGFVPVPGEGAWVIAPGMGRDGGDAAAVFGWEAGNQIHLQPVGVDPFPAETACAFSLWINVDGMSAGANKVLIEERATAEGRWGFGFGGLLVTANAAGDGWQQWTTGAGRYGEPDEQWRITIDGFSGGPDDVVLIDDAEVVCQLGDYSDVRANYMYSQGTSFATPLAAGVAALVLSEYPTLTGAEVKQAIMDGARALPALADTSLTGGRLDAYGALLAAAEIVRNGAASSSATGAGAGATDDTVAVGVGDAGEGEIPPMPLPGLPPCRGCPVPGADEEGEPLESATGPSGSESAPSDDTVTGADGGAFASGSTPTGALTVPPGGGGEGGSDAPWWLLPVAPVVGAAEWARRRRALNKRNEQLVAESAEAERQMQQQAAEAWINLYWRDRAAFDRVAPADVQQWMQELHRAASIGDGETVEVGIGDLVGYGLGPLGDAVGYFDSAAERLEHSTESTNADLQARIDAKRDEYIAQGLSATDAANLAEVEARRESAIGTTGEHLGNTGSAFGGAAVDSVESSVNQSVWKWPFRR